VLLVCVFVYAMRWFYSELEVFLSYRDFICAMRWFDSELEVFLSYKDFVFAINGGWPRGGAGVRH